MMSLDTIADRHILKEDIKAPREGPIREYRETRIPSDMRRSDRFSAAYGNMLERAYGTRGHEIWFALNEAIINFREHAHNYDPKKHIIVQGWRDDTRQYFTVGGFRKGFDPRTVYKTTKERDEKAASPRRGRGHIYIMAFADYVEYDREGKTMLLAFNIDQERLSRKTVQ